MTESTTNRARIEAGEFALRRNIDDYRHPGGTTWGNDVPTLDPFCLRERRRKNNREAWRLWCS